MKRFGKDIAAALERYVNARIAWLEAEKERSEAREELLALIGKEEDEDA